MSYGTYLSEQVVDSIDNLVTGESIVGTLSSNNDIFLSCDVSVYSFVKVHQAKELPLEKYLSFLHFVIKEMCRKY